MFSIIEKINESIRQGIARDPKRNYVGASAIGHPCRRKIWYEFKGYDGEPISEKLGIIFETGRRIEDMILSYLIGSDLNISCWILTEFCEKELPDFKGTCDAIIEINNEKIILEIKTANNASFYQFKKHGLKAWNEQYFSQGQSYMGMSGIKKDILLAINKDTSEMHEELVEYDDVYYEMLKQKAKDIIEAKELPSRMNNSPLFYMCKMCQFNKVCHSNKGE
jgi:hypothetical protein